MSEQLDRDLDQTLRGWMHAVAPVRAPGRLLEDTFGRTVATGQARSVPWGGISVAPRRRVVNRPAAWLVFAATVALVAAGLFGTGLLGGPGPIVNPRPTASPSASASPPAGSDRASPPLPPTTVVTPTSSIDIQKPLALASDGRALWVLTDESRIVRIDPATGAITASGQFGSTGDQWQGIAASTGALWVTDWTAQAADRVDPTTLKTVTKVQTGAALKGVLATPDAVWIANTHAGTVIRVDPKTNRVVDTITVGPAGNSGPNWLGSGLGSIWVDVPNNGTVVRIDPATDAIQATIPTTGVSACSTFGIAPDAVWVTECFDGRQLGRIDPRTNQLVAAIDLGGNAGGVTIIDGKPWTVVDHGGSDTGQLVRIDPATNAIDRVFTFRPAFSGGGDIGAIGDSVWVLDGGNNRVLRIPLTAFTA